MIWTIVLAVCVMGALAGAFALLLGWANARWQVQVPLQLRQLQDAMPGVNCGGCGYVGCNEYAEAVFRGEALPTLCPVGGVAVARRIAEIMGVEMAETLPMRAVVHCNADFDSRLKRAPYSGERTCAAANMVAGVQGCTYGCLGFRDCVDACKFDAIEMVNGLPRIRYDNCTGCGACAQACPRSIISMVPFRAERMAVVACSNEDAGKLVRGVCKAGCIACRACQKLNDNFQVTENLARVNYDQYDPQRDYDAPAQKCPTKVIVFAGPVPRKHLAGNTPGGVKPDVDSTVEHTPYRG